MDLIAFCLVCGFHRSISLYVGIYLYIYTQYTHAHMHTCISNIVYAFVYVYASLILRSLKELMLVI